MNFFPEFHAESKYRVCAGTVIHVFLWTYTMWTSMHVLVIFRYGLAQNRAHIHIKFCSMLVLICITERYCINQSFFLFPFLFLLWSTRRKTLTLDRKTENPSQLIIELSAPARAGFELTTSMLELFFLKERNKEKKKKRKRHIYMNSFFLYTWRSYKYFFPENKTNNFNVFFVSVHTVVDLQCTWIFVPFKKDRTVLA